MIATMSESPVWSAPRPVEESERVRALREMRILDTPREERFDRITRLAARIFDVPVSTIGFIDEDRLWFKSTFGFSMRETRRDSAFCSFTILQDDLLVIGDASTDETFSRMPTVVTEPHLRFYAGCALYSPDRFRVGTICMVDYRPRVLTAEDLQTLRDLASWVQTELRMPRMRRAQLELVFERERFNQHPRVDGHTRFWTREAITEILEHELRQSRSEQSSVGLIVIRIDDLASFDRQYGSAKRAVVLSDLAQSVRFSVRPYDFMGRWSEEELLLVLPGADLPKTAVAAERIRQKLASARFETPGGVASFTSTIGVASSSEDRSTSSSVLIAAAEEALRLALASGGNRTRLGSLPVTD